ncbi:MAG: hypothetical protein ACK5L7_07690 [Paludibacteraceae bacterium]
MKKVFFLAVIAVAIVSCGPKKTEQTVVEEDSIVSVDTIITNDSTVVDSTVSIVGDTISVK